MTKSCLIILILILKIQGVYSQINCSYESKNSKYFPTLLCLKDDDISSFCIVEVMGKEHPDNLYFEKGNYTLNGDSIFFRINEAGFDSESLVKENYVRKGFLERKAIILLNDNRELYLKLKRRNHFSRDSFCKECL